MAYGSPYSRSLATSVRAVSRLVRGWLPPLVLLLGCYGFWDASARANEDEGSTESIVYEAIPQTPVLSARRVPRTLAWPANRSDLQIYGGTAVEASPADTCVVYRVDGRSVFDHNGDEPLIPASNEKVVTTWAALRLLGPDTRFTTTVTAAVAPDAEGVIDGNLYLIGGGDPFLSTAAWRDQFSERSARYSTAIEDLAAAVAAAGVTEVTGDVVADESLFDSVRTGPWADRLVEQRQSGPLSAVAVNEGFVSWPATFVAVGNRTPTDDPPTQSAQVFMTALAEAGVRVAGAATGGVQPENAVGVAMVQSPTVTEIATHVNSYSNNYGAEILLKHIGRVQAGAGTTQAGVAAVVDLLQAEDLWTDVLSIHDGSGLSERNRITCDLMADILEIGAAEGFAETLAIGAERGSLVSRYTDSIAAGHVQAKTGTLRDVTALSGYAESVVEIDTAVVFSYIANEAFEGLSGPNVQDEMVTGLVTYPAAVDREELAPLDALVQ